MYKINAIGAKIENYVDNPKDILKSLLGYTIENEGDDWRSRGGNPQLTLGLEKKGLEKKGLEKKGLEKKGLEKKGLEKKGLENHPYLIMRCQMKKVSIQ